MLMVCVTEQANKKTKQQHKDTDTIIQNLR